MKSVSFAILTSYSLTCTETGLTCIQASSIYCFRGCKCYCFTTFLIAAYSQLLTLLTAFSGVFIRTHQVLLLVFLYIQKKDEQNGRFCFLRWHSRKCSEFKRLLSSESYRQHWLSLLKVSNVLLIISILHLKLLAETNSNNIIEACDTSQ